MSNDTKARKCHFSVASKNCIHCVEWPHTWNIGRPIAQLSPNKEKSFLAESTLNWGFEVRVVTLSDYLNSKLGFFVVEMFRLVLIFWGFFKLFWICIFYDQNIPNLKKNWALLTFWNYACSFKKVTPLNLRVFRSKQCKNIHLRGCTRKEPLFSIRKFLTKA